jgi:AcrR family transcriptional regulator
MPKVTEAHVEARRMQILEATCKCLGRKGMQRTTMRDICEEAGLSSGAVYGYFKSKDEIIEAVAELGRQNTRALLESHLTSEEAPAKLAEILVGAVEFLASEGAGETTRVDLRLWAEGLDNPRIQELFLQAYANITEPIVEIVRDGQAKGEIETCLDPESVARVLAGVVLGLSVQRAMDPGTDLDGCVDILGALLRGGFVAEKKTEP